jgi:hypothetical protein
MTEICSTLNPHTVDADFDTAVFARVAASSPLAMGSSGPLPSVSICDAFKFSALRKY